jgi:hypothetical protein
MNDDGFDQPDGSINGDENSAKSFESKIAYSCHQNYSGC